MESGRTGNDSGQFVGVYTTFDLPINGQTLIS